MDILTALLINHQKIQIFTQMEAIIKRVIMTEMIKGIMIKGIIKGKIEGNMTDTEDEFFCDLFTTIIARSKLNPFIF